MSISQNFYGAGPSDPKDIPRVLAGYESDTQELLRQFDQITQSQTYSKELHKVHNALRTFVEKEKHRSEDIRKRMEIGVHKVRQRYLAKQSVINKNISWVHFLQITVLYVCIMGVLAMLSAEGKVSRGLWLSTSGILTIVYLIYIGIWWNDHVRRDRINFNKYDYSNVKTDAGTGKNTC